MILNKSAHERGFGHGTVYKSYPIDLADAKGALKGSIPTLHFGIGPDVRMTKGDYQHPAAETVDLDGLPFAGARLAPGGLIAAYIDDTTGRTRFVKYKGDEVAYVDTVRLLGALPHHSIMSPLG